MRELKQPNASAVKSELVSPGLAWLERCHILFEVFENPFCLLHIFTGVFDAVSRKIHVARNPSEANTDVVFGAHGIKHRRERFNLVSTKRIIPDELNWDLHRAGSESKVFIKKHRLIVVFDIKILELVELFDVKSVSWSLFQLLLCSHNVNNLTPKKSGNLRLKIIPQLGTMICFYVAFAANTDINWRNYFYLGLSYFFG